MIDEAEVAKLVSRLTSMRALAARAMQESPGDVRALHGAGMAYRLSGDLPAAAAAFARAVQAEPNNTHFLFELGQTQEYLGRFEAAGQSYERALRAEPLNYKARQALVQLHKQSIANNSIAELERLFAGPDQDGWRTLHIGYALAKTHEDFGDFEHSFAWLARAKARRGALQPYSPEREEALVTAVIAATARPPAIGEGAAEPIFVAGLPRSGTTLVDRILSSHPDVMSAGEIGNFAQICKRMTGSTAPATLDPDTFVKAENVDFSRLGKLYIDSTRPLTGSTPRFVDKAPSNYFFAGMILRALPNSRVVCIRRHPLDSVLSNYKQIFPIDDRYYDYVYGLESAAHKFVQFDRLMAHWRTVLAPERFLELSYEHLVSDQEARTRALLAFCGLAWDERCLAFHENSTAVSTPSAVQVRSPMYASAMGRWSKYGALLDPARRVLEQAGVAIG